jgi:tRNA dimethylallyltransferase
LYKEITIASAKPTVKERRSIPHFGIDVLLPSDPFNVTLFFALYEEAKTYAKEHNSPLIIVGGTSFYLKAMLEGLSQKPPISKATRAQVHALLQDIPALQAFVEEKDPVFAQKVEKFDRYRLEKWSELYLETGEIPSAFQARTKQPPIIQAPLPLFEIETDRTLLRERITLRTDNMLTMGLLDEVRSLEERYGRMPSCMHAIGIKEVLAYFDGEYDAELMREKIITHTARLAKRQRTFNKTQFNMPLLRKPLVSLFDAVAAYM